MSDRASAEMLAALTESERALTASYERERQARTECERLRAAWRLVERYCDTYPTDWRLVFKRGGEVLEVSVPEEVWRAFDAALVEADDE